MSLSRALGLASSSRAAIKASCPCAVRPFSTTPSAASTSTLTPPLPYHGSRSTLTPSPLPESSSTETSALSLLASQPSHYVSALLLGRRYLLTPNDILTVPHLRGVSPGTTIALTRILEVGSRDYTLRAAVGSAVGVTTTSRSDQATKAPLLTPALARSATRDGVPRDWQRHPDSLPYLGQEVVRASLLVLEHTKGKMFEVTKFKKRKGYRRLLRSKLEFTKLRVGEIVIGEGNREE